MVDMTCSDIILLPILTFVSFVLGVIYEERQFIIVPGETNVTVANQTTPEGDIDTFWLECNTGTKVHVFDTFDWEFKSEFDPSNKGSKDPPSIVKLVGGNSTGGATVSHPTQSRVGHPILRTYIFNPQ